MVKVAIVGASGYTALELIKLLLNHPQVEIAALTTRQEGSPSIAAIHPSLAGRLDLPCENLTPAQIASRAKFVFTALPHVAAMGVVGLFAVFHGHAHGAEIPESAGGVAYAAGFMIATALLHLAGITAGFLIGRAGEHYGSLVVRMAGGFATVAGLGLLIGIL